MKVTIERTTLQKALNHVQSVVERRSTIPILSNVLMRAEGGTLSLTATDLDIEIVEHVPADVTSAGVITASAVTLFDIVKKLPDGAQINLDAESAPGQLMIEAGRASFNLAALAADEFPVLGEEATGTTFSIPAADLLRLIDKTRFAMSMEEARFYLNGIYFHVAGEGADQTLRAVATDGHRLACLDVSLPDGAADMPAIIVPRKAVLELKRLIDDLDGDATVTVSDTRIRFTLADIRLTSKLIDGSFPEYERVIPRGNDKVMQLDNDAFRRAVDRVSTVSADKTRSIKLAIGDDRLELLVNNPETGSASEELSVDFRSDPLDIGFNAKYLVDIADQIDGETASFYFADTASPTLIKDADDPHAIYVIMPLRV